MSPVHQYKKLENEFVTFLVKNIHVRWQQFTAFLKRVHQKGKQRFTVMFIPHSEKRIFNFQISVFTLIFFASLLAILIITFIGLSTHFTSTNERYVKASRNLSASETSLESFKDEITELRKVTKGFKTRMEQVLAVVGTEQSRNFLEKGTGGELTVPMAVAGLEESSLRDLSDLRSLRAYLSNTVEPLAEICSLLSTQKDLLVDIPTLWPLKGVRGNITTYFGPTKHPFTGGWYLHTGVDIAWGYGIPIVATANGKVQNIDFDPMQLGHYLVLRHKYGFYTRYGHLNSAPIVRKGEEVRRGQVIGYMGSTGLSTGPHLHYEVRIGTQLVDPLQFLSIKSPLMNNPQQKVSYSE